MKGKHKNAGTLPGKKQAGIFPFPFRLPVLFFTLAPVYDNGSCLFPQADQETMETLLNDPDERNSRIYQYPLSGIKLNRQKINYFDFLSSLKNADCNAALKRIAPKVDLGKINEMVDQTPYLSDLQRKFFKTMLMERKTKILDYSYDLLLKREQKIERKRRIERAGR